MCVVKPVIPLSVVLVITFLIGFGGWWRWYFDNEDWAIIERDWTKLWVNPSDRSL